MLSRRTAAAAYLGLVGYRCGFCEFHSVGVLGARSHHASHHHHDQALPLCLALPPAWTEALPWPRSIVPFCPQRP